MASERSGKWSERLKTDKIMLLALLLTWVAPLQGGIPPSLAQVLAAIEDDVRRLRELEAKSLSTVEFITQQEANQRFERSYAEKRDAEPMAQAQLFWRALDLVEADVDLEALSLAYDQATISGFYGSDSETMVIILPQKLAVANRLPLAQKLTYAHEYVHALQDQHFDLSALWEGIGESSSFDQRLSLSALIEGDANFVTWEYFFKLREENSAAIQREMEAWEDVEDETRYMPAIFNAINEFVYEAGEEFVYQLWFKTHWRGVNKAFHNRLPQTSEQIYHPHKYFNKEAALEVNPPDLGPRIDEGWRLAYDDVVGEFYLRQHLLTQLSANRATVGAQGWGGDRLHIYTDAAGDGMMWVWYQLWDSAKEAAEFAGDYSHFLNLRYESESDDGQCWSGETMHCFARISETETRISMAADQETALALLDA